MDPVEIESGLFCLPFREHRMPATHKLRIIDAHRPSLTSGLMLAALRESREQEAARVIRRHRDLIQNFQAIELSGRATGSNSHG
jgi:hypothetical protein